MTLFKLDEGVDTGPVLAQLEIPLTENTDAEMLYQMVNRVHIKLIIDVYPKVVTNTVLLREQDHSAATMWPARTPDDGQIDLAGSVNDAERMVRAVTKPYPGAFYFDDKGRKLIVWSAKITNGPTNGRTLSFSDGYLELKDWNFA